MLWTLIPQFKILWNSKLHSSGKLFWQQRQNLQNTPKTSSCIYASQWDQRVRKKNLHRNTYSPQQKTIYRLRRVTAKGEGSGKRMTNETNEKAMEDRTGVFVINQFVGGSQRRIVKGRCGEEEQPYVWWRRRRVNDRSFVVFWGNDLQSQVEKLKEFELVLLGGSWDWLVHRRIWWCVTMVRGGDVVVERWCRHRICVEVGRFCVVVR